MNHFPMPLPEPGNGISCMPEGQDLPGNSSDQYLLSHAVTELSNILIMMKGALKYIETTHPEVRCYKYWLDVRDDAARMQDILRSLTGYHQGACLTLARADLQKLLRGSYLACLPLVEGTQKTLTFTSRTNGPCLLLDSSKMRNAFINLIKNAIEAVGPTGWVHIVLTKSSEKAVIQIEDNGCGIPPEHLLSIFEPFVTYRPGSAGLGLSIVKRVLDAHQGSILVSSRPGQGTTFTISLPIPSAQKTATI